MRNCGRNHTKSIKKRKKFMLTKTAIAHIAKQSRKAKVSKNAYLVACIYDGLRFYECENLFLHAAIMKFKGELK